VGLKWKSFEGLKKSTLQIVKCKMQNEMWCHAEP
jgi:hypothetical protein